MRHRHFAIAGLAAIGFELWLVLPGSQPAYANPVFADERSLSNGAELYALYCSECHGQNLEGFAPINAPPLEVAKGYSAEQFAQLMHDGVALGDRRTRLMSPTSQVRFSQFTPDEVAAVHAFLQSR